MNPSPEIKTEDRQERRWLGLERPHFAGWQWKVLVLLTAVNLLNYFDRMIVFPMFAYLKDEFSVSDLKLGALGSILILVNSLAVLPLGYWSERGNRQKIMAGGVLFWSLATTLSGFAATFKTLLTARALVGVGGAKILYDSLTLSKIGPMVWVDLRIRPAGLAFCVGLSLAIGLAASGWSAWRAARANIADALRSTG